MLRLCSSKHLRLTPASLQAIQSFHERFLHLERRSRACIEEASRSDEYAYFLSGSDQIWSGMAVEGHDWRFLRFAPAVKRVAWAPSLGGDKVADYNRAYYREAMKEYALLSAREKKVAQLIGEMAHRKVDVLCDPVFLLSAEDWRTLSGAAVTDSGRQETKQYLFAFFIDEPSDRAVDFLQHEAEGQCLQVCSFGYRSAKLEHLPEYRHLDGDPFEFVRSLEAARLVVTDSFHAVAFSVLLHRAFYVFERQYVHAESQSVRITDLLEEVSLPDCYMPVCRKNEWDFKKADEYVLRKRLAADAYLSRAASKGSFVAVCRDRELIKNSSSGGMFAVLARKVLQEGGVVYGAAMCQHDGGLSVRHISVADESELYRLQGSKYVQSDMSQVKADVKCQLEAGKQVLFVGTSCQVAALKSFLKQGYERLLTVDLVCHGVPSHRLLTEYIRFLEKKFGKRVEDLKFRDREDSSCPYVIRLRFMDGTFARIGLRDSSYYRLFMSCLGYRMSCYSCHFAHTDKPADLTLGDFYLRESRAKALGFEPEDRYLSCVLTHTPNGVCLLREVESECHIQSISLEETLSAHAQLRHPSIPRNRHLWKKYQQGGFEAVGKYIQWRNRLTAIGYYLKNRKR